MPGLQGNLLRGRASGRLIMGELFNLHRGFSTSEFLK
jgi:hypothetical protein